MSTLFENNFNIDFVSFAGWEHGWHGRTDILMEEVQVCTVGENEEIEEHPVSSSSSSLGIEVKTYKSDKFPDADFFQILAETIAYSFLKNREKREITLIPTLAINKDYIQVHFYDSEEDVLIQSAPLFFMQSDTFELCYNAVLVVWMTLNYRIFCGGVIDGMCKAEFIQKLIWRNLKKELNRLAMQSRIMIHGIQGFIGLYDEMLQCKT